MANLDPWSYAAKTRSEHAEQVALFMWANMAMNFGLEAANNPDSYNKQGVAKSYIQPCDGHKPLMQLTWLHAISNHGAGFGRKAEGVKKGVPDLFLPVPINFGYRSKPEGVAFITGMPICAGLYIELKRLDSEGKAQGKPSQEQLDFQEYARATGYAHEIIFGWELARDCILRYLNVS